MLHYAAATYNWSDYFELPADAQLIQHHSAYVNTAIDNLKNMGDQSVSKRLTAAVKVPLVDFRTPDKNVWWAKARGTKGDIYIVKLNFSKKSAKCTCADFANRGVVCKHIIKVALEMQEMFDAAKEQILAMEERSAIQAEGLQDSDDPLQRAFQSRGASFRRRFASVSFEEAFGIRWGDLLLRASKIGIKSNLSETGYKGQDMETRDLQALVSDLEQAINDGILTFQRQIDDAKLLGKNLGIPRPETKLEIQDLKEKIKQAQGLLALVRKAKQK